MPQVRVRFAPSPTGYLHIGGARTALYNYLFARHEKGTLILRIEDTDQARSTPESIQAILDSLKWLGIEWDEGPFFQSERKDIYNSYAQKLLDSGRAFHRDDPGKGRAIVFKMKTNTTIKVNDLIHGIVAFDSAHIGDVVMIKSDSFPTYNFACVVDDIEMGITHVIRGDDHLSNTPKQVAIYEALSATPPQFVHIPLIMGEDGSRLSKRHGHTSVTEYRDLGYLPEAVFNFLSLLGWSPGDDTELMNREELIRRFSIERVKHTPAQFNLKKLIWINNHYLKNMPDEVLANLLKPYLVKAGYDLSGVSEDWLKQMVDLYRERGKTLMEVVEASRFFFVDEIEYQPEAVDKVLKKDSAKQVLTEVLKQIEDMADFNKINLEKILRDLADKYQLKFKDVAQPIRVALTGTTVSPPIFETMELVGKAKVIQRMERVLKSCF